jgi:hypothetical protein
MTVFGWDASHFDGALSRTILARARSEGIAFFTHKIGEGSTYDDVGDATALAAARDAGIEFIGGYFVVRTTSPVPIQVDACVRLADRDEPWWRSFPGWFWQVDLERWAYDNVPASVGIDFARQLHARTGRWTILYASKGQYGDSLSGWEGPLWNANYGTNPTGGFQSVYPGDGSSRWGAYSGHTPTFLQYGSNATIAGLTTCDANAYRGSVESLRALITGGTAMGTANWPEQQADLAGALATAIIHGKTEVDLPGSNNNWEVDDATRKPKFIFSGYGVPVLKQIDEIHTAVKAGTGQSTVTLSAADKAEITQALAGLVPTAAEIAKAVLDEQHRRDEA